MAARGDSWASDYYDDDPTNYKTVIFGNERNVDHHAQDLFMEAFFDKNDAAYVELVDYMRTRYGIDFEDNFQWLDFREWYEGQQAK